VPAVVTSSRSRSTVPSHIRSSPDRLTTVGSTDDVGEGDALSDGTGSGSSARTDELIDGDHADTETDSDDPASSG